MIQIIPLLIFIGCGNSSVEINKSGLKKASTEIATIKIDTVISKCNVDFDSTLTRLAKSFSARDIGLGLSISGELNQFLIKVDTNCLRKQIKYQYFITVILAKLALYQVKYDRFVEVNKFVRSNSD